MVDGRPTGLRRFPPPGPARPGGIRFLFDCGVVAADRAGRLVLQEDEIGDARWVDPGRGRRAVERAGRPAGGRALRAADGTVYLEDGRPVSGGRG